LIQGCRRASLATGSPELEGTTVTDVNFRIKSYMSPLRAALLSQPIRAVSNVRLSRRYSDDHHGHHDHHGEAEHVEYAPEGAFFEILVGNGDLCTLQDFRGRFGEIAF
jgi:hypothetical protein